MKTVVGFGNTRVRESAKSQRARVMKEKCIKRRKTSNNGTQIVQGT